MGMQMVISTSLGHPDNYTHTQQHLQPKHTSELTNGW